MQLGRDGIDIYNIETQAGAILRDGDAPGGIDFDAHLC